MNDPLATYLHDHLAGSHFAIKLLESLYDQYKDEELGHFALGLCAEVKRDQDTLKQIIDHVGKAQNQHRYLIQQMRTNWGSKAEPGDDSVVAERPLLLRKMATMLYGDPIDLPRLTRDSGLPVSLLRDLLAVDQAPGKLLEFKKS